MRTINAAGATPETRNAQTGKVWALANFINYGDNTDSISALRLQFLSRLGLSPARAHLVAALAWESMA